MIKYVPYVRVKAVQTDNLCGVCLVVSLSLDFTTRPTQAKLRLTAALSGDES